MKSGRTFLAFIIILLTVGVFSSCSTSNSTSQYPVHMKKKRVAYTASGNKKAPPTIDYSSSSKQISKAPPKNYIIPDRKKSPLYK